VQVKLFFLQEKHSLSYFNSIFFSPSLTDMIAWAEWNYLNANMWIFELPSGVTWRQRKKLQFVPLNKSRLASFLGALNVAATGTTTTTNNNNNKKKVSIQLQRTSNPISNKKNRQTLSRRPISKPRGTLMSR
jgi:hypothetical protein